MSLRHWFNILVSSALVLLSLLLVAAVMVIGTETGRVWLAETGLSAAAEGFHGRLQWQGIRSPDINHWWLDSLVIVRLDTARIEAGGIALRWQPLALLRGRVILDALRLERLAIEPSSASAGAASIGGGAAAAAALPVSVQSLSIATLVLPVPEGNIPREWQVSGTLDLFSGTSLLAAELRGSPLTAAGSKLTLAARMAGDRSAQFSGRYSETPAGPVSVLLKLPRDEPFETSFNARLDRPHGDYRLAIRELAFKLWRHDFAIKGELHQDGTALATQALHIDVDGSEQLLKGRVTQDGMAVKTPYSPHR